ncbi:hypothetical protein AAFF_G00133410 [Aldrovandia affinis]|uniref:Uncharacterized protein n=1 Tax=Aldrovandia affinis TaxID=143900 RepID=A0AAD7RQN7_9TELE|nr:hypothetical protein AAFF_G00133410 [Aldrovandia affinis]
MATVFEVVHNTVVLQTSIYGDILALPRMSSTLACDKNRTTRYRICHWQQNGYFETVEPNIETWMVERTAG